MNIFQPVRITAKPRWPQIGRVIGKPPRWRRRTAEIVTVNREISGQPTVDASDQLSFVGAMVLPRDRKCARMLGYRPFKIWHRSETVSTGDAVNLSIPRAAPKVVVKPFD